jgi:beta-galactosidase/beta-glucuronidase
MELKGGQNQAVHIYQQTIGFREVEVRKQALWINSVPVKL